MKTGSARRVCAGRDADMGGTELDQPIWDQHKIWRAAYHIIYQMVALPAL